MKQATIIILLILLTLLAGCDAGANPAAAPAAIPVGAVVPLSGAFAGGGAQVERGYRMAVEDVNAGGGVYVAQYDRHVPLELILLDDASDPTQTVAHMESLAQQGVVAYLGGYGSTLHAAAAAIAEKNAIPYLGVAFALRDPHEAGYHYLFSPFPKSPDFAAPFFEMVNSYVPVGERPTRVAIFQEATDWGIEMAALWQQAAPVHGYEVVVHETYTPGASDYTDLILKAKEAGAELVLALPTPPDGFAMMKQMGELDYVPALSYFIRATDVPTWRDLGPIGDYAILASGWHPALGFPGVEALNEAHLEEHGRLPDPMVGPAYATVQILADAIARAGALEPDAIRDALAATEMETVVGPVTFREDGTGVVIMPFAQYQEGEVELIWPREFATAPLVYPAPPVEER